jgi:exopolyphosphatase/guanosine-5'-triphosphate,3'-diphosphate pyrophosphatase
MIKAGIDIGTNTALMVVADVHDDGTYRVLHDVHTLPRLGEGLLQHGVISPSSMARGVESMQTFRTILEQAQPERTLVVATSAMREAANGADVQQHLEEALGRSITIIDGTREAELTFLGAVGNSPVPSLVIDIGGGSTEYAFGVDGAVTFSRSIPIGAVKATELFARDRPLTERMIADARMWVREALEEVASLRDAASTCIGVAGTPVALAMIDADISEYSAERVEGYVLTHPRVCELADWLCSLTLDEVRSIPGLHERRADIVPMGARILAESMDVLGCNAMTVVTRGLRYGAMLTA